MLLRESLSIICVVLVRPNLTSINSELEYLRIDCVLYACLNDGTYNVIAAVAAVAETVSGL